MLTSDHHLIRRPLGPGHDSGGKANGRLADEIDVRYKVGARSLNAPPLLRADSMSIILPHTVRLLSLVDSGEEECGRSNRTRRGDEVRLVAEPGAERIKTEELNKSMIGTTLYELIRQE